MEAGSCLLTPIPASCGKLPLVASPAETPPPPSRSRWHGWWKVPLFFGVLAGALALDAHYDGKGGVLLLLLLAYIAVRVILMLIRLVRKR